MKPRGGGGIKQSLMKIGQSKTLFKCQTIISTVAINSFTLALAKDITFVLVCFENTFCFLCRHMQHFLGKSDIYVDPTASYCPCLCPLWVVVGGWLQGDCRLRYSILRVTKEGNQPPLLINSLALIHISFSESIQFEKL